ncbi:zinc-dependent alcohol dehydrogenase family protein [Aspergillus saccharolyticus JOP 1030-1]|uniref:Alcohol dehydrogenase n=1 Tax=Aspergillus saccharolyticus JOP 1030-1 TaxID=1450539 RepID=A0A319A2T6_9EURO|nr:alcohol dehydrogenase [Aspergillus saccharolyticus JOP 1030-1]PYH41762.1 alcohol dehydrogenase [Aspergillus saccharolyticus JOP 1030-1]
MSLPQSYQAYRRTEGTAPLTIEQVTEKLPPVKSHDVLVRIHAVSLNYRDIAMLDDTYPQPCLPRGIPASDCAAEVVFVGSEVSGFKPGDRVTAIWDLTNLAGTEEQSPEALGGDVDGVLRQYAVFNEQVLVHLPDHLSWEEASCITCAGTTAWNALEFPRKSGTALLQGTGGVSMFALLLCIAADVQSIITSSSDEKLDQARSLGPHVRTINYRKVANWEEEVVRLTNGRGADVAIENVGPATVKQSLASLAQRGTLSLVGFLGGLDAEKFPDLYFPVLVKRVTMRGIVVGSKIDQQALCDFLAEKKVSLKPLIDAVFPFEKSKEAFARLKSGKHQGKIVITL